VGAVTHRRMRPVAHALRYRLFELYLDLDEAEDLSRKSRVFGFNRARLMSFHERDHGDGTATPLKAQIEGRLAEAGLPTGGAVRVLSMPRVLGFVFNPITLYLCHMSAGDLSAVVYEVNNTFGNRTFYVLPASESLRHEAEKAMHVSPFMDMDLRYAFHLKRPGERFDIAIRVLRGDELVMTAAFHGGRRPFTDMGLLKVWAGQPWLTVEVVAGIHWEALKLLMKGMGLRKNPHRHRGMVSARP
jgi:DUF1365 family protein